MSEYWTDLGIGNYGILQDTDDYAFTQDSVFLANTADLRPTDSVLDLGAGCGILSALAVIKKGVSKAVGIELQPDTADMARRSSEHNRISDKMEIVCGDVCDIKKLVKAESFDKVLCNPPYFSSLRSRPLGSGNEIPIDNSTSVRAREIAAEKDKKRAISRSGTPVDAFVSAAAFALRFGGDLYIVYKMQRLTELLYSLHSNDLEPKNITFIYPKLSSGADTAIVKARKGGKIGLTTDTIIVMDEDGNYTKRTKRLYS